MPVAFGPSRPHPAGVFDDVLSLSVVYRSDRQAIASVLPEPFEPDADPLVHIYCQQCRGVNFLAGGSYNLVGVNVAAVFNGVEDQVRGQFALVLWENAVAAIIRGRELLGIPKLFGDIPDPTMSDNKWHVQLRENGRTLIQMNLEESRELTPAEIESLHESQAHEGWFGWRYIPNINGIGAALSQPQQIGIENTYSRGWECTGETAFSDVEWETNPTSADILAGLRTLPLQEFVGASRMQGSVTLTRAKHRVLQ